MNDTNEIIDDLKEQNTQRYYVDERGGCIAVRDREKYDGWSSGLHASMIDVVSFWGGRSELDNKNMVIWVVQDWQRDKSTELCDILNVINDNSER